MTTPSRHLGPPAFVPLPLGLWHRRPEQGGPKAERLDPAPAGVARRLFQRAGPGYGLTVIQHACNVIRMGTDVTDRADELNALPDEHWDRWYATERYHGERLDYYLSLGYPVDLAADQAARDTLRNPR